MSHRLIQNRLTVDFLNLLVWRREADLVDHLRGRSDAQPREVIDRQYAAKKAEADAHCKMWSAFWTAIESAVTRFCLEAELTQEQLFAMLSPVPPVIEEARHALDPEMGAGDEPALSLSA